MAARGRGQGNVDVVWGSLVNFKGAAGRLLSVKIDIDRVCAK
jgi:hypothetical protein